MPDANAHRHHSVEDELRPTARVQSRQTDPLPRRAGACPRRWRKSERVSPLAFRFDSRRFRHGFLECQFCERFGVDVLKREGEQGRESKDSGLTLSDFPRRIRYFDAENNLSLVFLTNNFTLPALIIAAIYRRRWEIELFFRWIKQHLRLRGFFSTSPNGVAVQIWTAICSYLLVAIAKRELALPGSLHQVLQIVSISALEKVPILELFTENYTREPPFDNLIQLELNGF